MFIIYDHAVSFYPWKTLREGVVFLNTSPAFVLLCENSGLGGAFLITMFANRAISPIIAIMFYEVHILDRRGKTKKVLSSKFLSKRHWNLFPETTNRKAALKKSQIKIEQTPLKELFQ